MRRWVLCLLLFLSPLVALMRADDINLTINLSMIDCYGLYCDANPGSMGDPAFARADFSLINEPWSFELVTGPALSWGQNGDEYSATFGYGGSFTMIGPEGLTFSGVVTSGGSSGNSGSWGVTVDYFGQWSNGVYAEGSADVIINEHGRVSSADLNSAPAPEPSSFVLLGSGLLGLIGFGQRML